MAGRAGVKGTVSKEERAFGRLAARFVGDPGVSEGTGFGASPGLRVRNRIFAMLINGELVVKLPESRVDGLIAAGIGRRFDPGHKRVMREWLSVPSAHTRRWPGLAAEAYEFVGSAKPRPR